MAFRRVLLAPDGSVPEGDLQIVMSDLARFCSAALPATRLDSTGRVDALATAQVIGRQEVWFRIQAMLNLPLREVTNLGISGNPAGPEAEEIPHD